MSTTYKTKSQSCITYRSCFSASLEIICAYRSLGCVVNICSNFSWPLDLHVELLIFFHGQSGLTAPSLILLSCWMFSQETYFQAGTVQNLCVHLQGFCLQSRGESSAIEAHTGHLCCSCQRIAFLVQAAPQGFPLLAIDLSDGVTVATYLSVASQYLK